MARKTRYLGYLNGLQKKDNRGRKTSTKESVLSRLKDLKAPHPADADALAEDKACGEEIFAYQNSRSCFDCGGAWRYVADQKSTGHFGRF